MPSSDGSAPEIGLTGARFGGAPRKRRKKVDPFPEPAPAPESDVGHDPIGLTGARFGGAARRRPDPPAPPVDPEPPVTPPAPDVWRAVPALGPEPEQAAEPSTYTLVRPYVLTGGRTRGAVEFAVEALLTARPGPQQPREPIEHARIRGLCAEPRSVAEVSALVGLPLGVVRVLLADMHGAGAIAVHRTADAGGPDLALMERVLAGLRRL